MRYPQRSADAVAMMPSPFWRVYNYVARQWYDVEYGRVELSDRWYGPTVAMLERIAWTEQVGGR